MMMFASCVKYFMYCLATFLVIFLNSKHILNVISSYWSESVLYTLPNYCNNANNCSCCIYTSTVMVASLSTGLNTAVPRDICPSPLLPVFDNL